MKSDNRSRDQSGAGVGAKECSQPLEARKGKEMVSSLAHLKITQLY